MVPTKNLFENEIYINKIQKLLQKLEITPKSLDNYLLAFVHRSLVNERPDLSPIHNERLEFLGDAVLELVVTHKLYSDYPDKQEGVLTDYRASIVKGKYLSSVAKSLGFPEYLILGKGEELSGGRESDYMLADATEAFIGALYLDLGYERSREFILKNIYSNLDDIISNHMIKDFKSLLQEWTQADFGITPNYKVLEDYGEDHAKSYKSGVFLGERLIGAGIGSSKKKSQESAAKDAFLSKDNINLK